MRPDPVLRKPNRRDLAVVSTAGAAAVILLLISTLEIGLFEERLALRLVFMLAGMIPAGWILFRLVPGGVIGPANRRSLLLAIFFVHIFATLYFFPPADILNDRPVLTLDHSFHYYQAYRAREVLWDTFRIDRYDPYFMAGYPGGTIFDLDMKGAEIFCALVPFLNVARALKLFILAVYLTMLAALYWGSRMQGFELDETVLGLVIFLLYWHWGRPYASNFRFAGMFSFVCATHLCFLLVGMLRQVSRGAWIKTFFILGPIAFLIHPTAALMLPVPFAVSLAIDRRCWRPKKCLVLILWCLGVVFVNYIWLAPFFKYMWMKTTTEFYFQIEGWRGLIKVVCRPSCLIAISMIALAAVGGWRLVREKRLSMGLPVLAGSVFLFFVASTGVYFWGLNQLEPGRFLFSGFLFLTPLAGAGTNYLREVILRLVRPEPVRRFLGALFVVALVLAMLPLSLLESKSFYRHTVSTSYPPKIAALIEGIDSRIDSSGRLMIEDLPAAYYGDTHLPGLLPLTTGVEQIGGPYPHTYLLYYFATFKEEQTFGKALEQWDTASFQTYLDLYNISWILTAKPRSGRLVADLLGGDPLWSLPPFYLWQVDLSQRRTTGNHPRIRGEINRITIENADASNGYMLCYHWVPGLSVAPPARISPRNLADDPVPFIHVEPNGASKVIITY